MMKKRLGLLFVFGLLTISLLMILPAVYGESPVAAEFRSCLDSKSNTADCSAALSECNQAKELKEKTFLDRYSECSNGCPSQGKYMAYLVRIASLVLTLAGLSLPESLAHGGLVIKLLKNMQLIQK